MHKKLRGVWRCSEDRQCQHQIAPFSLTLHSSQQCLCVLQSQFESGPKTKTLVETLAKVGADPEEYTLLILNEQVSALQGMTRPSSDGPSQAHCSPTT